MQDLFMWTLYHSRSVDFENVHIGQGTQEGTT